MAKVPLTCEELANIDEGSLGVLVKQRLMAIARDCLDRPTVNTKRQLKITIDFIPVANGPDLKHVEVQAECYVKIPVYRTAPMSLAANMNGFKVTQESKETDEAETDDE
jgi:hypothetical protein